MTTFSVNSTSALLSALKQAKSGDVVMVDSGTYSKVSIKNLTIAGNVTVTSANPDKPAVFTDLIVHNSSGLTFQDLELSAAAGASNPFQVRGSSRIVLDRLDVHGTMNGDVSDDGQLMLVRSSTNVTVSNSEFQQAMNALSLIDNDGVKVDGNSFHDLRTDGVRGGGTSNLVVSNNYFTNFYPRTGDDGSAPDHADAIQLWTKNTTESAENITIKGNLIVRGEGLQTQGIFFRDQVGDLPFKNVNIVDNTVIGAMANGIRLGGVEGLTVTGNEVVALEGQKSHISLSNVKGAAVSGNQASSFVFDEMTDTTRSDNILLDTLSVAEGRSLARVIAKTINAKDVAAGADPAVKAAVTALGYVDQPVGGKVAPQTFAQIQIAGTAGDDRLSAAKVGDSRVDGGNGDDSITGGAAGSQGRHELVGGKGDDTYTIRSANDTVIEKAGQGADVVVAYIDYTLGANVETLRLVGDGLTGTGNELDNRIVGSAGADKIYGLAGDDLIQGGDGGDFIWGGVGNDSLRGDDGNDSLWGGDGNDTIIGADGDDILYGDAGNDVLQGGAGNDRMTGGAGNDIFRFRADDVSDRAIDTITDFTRGQDRIELSAIDAKAATAANEAFSFIGTQSFHKVAGELRYEQVGGQTKIYGDVNGDGVADFTIVLTKAMALSAGDFTL